MTKDAARLVLVVEDDISVRRPLVKFLEMHGFTVVTAETSDEGLEALKKNEIVAAVVDLRLLRGSGRDVVTATPADIPVIIFSGVPSESAELERIRPRTRPIENPYSPLLSRNAWRCRPLRDLHQAPMGELGAVGPRTDVERRIDFSHPAMPAGRNRPRSHYHVRLRTRGRLSPDARRDHQIARVHVERNVDPRRPLPARAFARGWATTSFIVKMWTCES
jgi:CheY-like chemotaxis protein